MTTIYSLRAKLFHEKRTYRDIEISGEESLYDLAKAITESFAFDFDHAFGFYSNCSNSFRNSPDKYELFVDMEGGASGDGAKSVEENNVRDAFHSKKQKMLFLFDYGDDWRFEIEVMDIKEAEKGVKYPRVTKSAGTAPRQYPDYEEEEGLGKGEVMDALNHLAENAEESLVRKMEITKKLFDFVGENAGLSEAKMAKKMQEFMTGIESEMAEIEKMEREEEKNALPQNENQKALVAYFEGKDKPDDAMLQRWIEEKWENSEANFPLLRRYARQQNKQLEQLILFSLADFPNNPDVIDDLFFIHSYYPEEASRETLVESLIKACDAEKENMEDFTTFLGMLLEEMEGDLPDALYYDMDFKYQVDRRKYAIFKKMAGKRTAKKKLKG